MSDRDLPPKPVNILFVNYGDFTTNSLNHIGGFANTLTGKGHACVVAVPSGKDSIASVSSPAFIPALFNELLQKPAFFPDGRSADVIHAWTPRECVRKFVLSYQGALEHSARLIVHLEDNEEHLITGFSGYSIPDLRNMGPEEWDAKASDRLPHPVRYRTFLRTADHITVIVDRLREFVPEGIASSLLEPGVDPAYFESRAGAAKVRAELGISAGEKVISFTGSTTFANEPEMLDLYRAVALLNRGGTPTKLVRTGFSRPQFQASLTAELTSHVIDLGFVEKGRLPGLLSAADVLVQPGRPGPFNDYRLPSKLPEFLASGRPVILPPTNVALAMKDGDEALFLSDGSPENIAECCARVFKDPKLAAALGQRGAAFARSHFDQEKATAGLLETYLKVFSQPSRAKWAMLRSSGGSELTLAARDLADAVGTADGSTEDTAGLARDVADLVRLEDARTAGLTSAADTLRRELEEKVHHLEMQRDLTKQHVQNLQEKVELQDKHFKLHKKLSDRHIQNLETRITGIEKRARDQKEEAAAAAAAAARQAEQSAAEHARLSARIVEMESELKAREARLRAIIHSRAYKLSAPLRDIERLFRGKPAPAAPVARAPSVAATPVPAAPAPASAAPPQPVPAPAPPIHHYTFNFDHPRTWSTASNKLLILGWCYENAAAPIRGIRAHFGEDTIPGIYGSKRLDVLASTGMRQAEYCGIKIEIPTVIGDHLLIVEVQHDDGWTPYFQTLVHVGKAGDPAALSEYETWCQQHEKLEETDLASIRQHIASFSSRPVISVVMPVYNTPEALLRKAVQSVQDQVYPHWQLCIADDASTLPHVKAALESLEAADPRISVAYRSENGHICEATNTALALAKGPYVALFDHDDVLAPTALYEVAAELDAHPDAQFIYSDEDKIDMEDRRFDPYFKPDWNPDLFHGQNYTSHLSVYRTDLIRSLGGFRKGFEGSQDWDLNLRAIEKIPESAIRHIPKLLYHWRAAPGSTALQLAEKSYPVDAARRAREDHFRRLGATVEIAPVPGDHWRIRYPVPSPAPLVSLIIPTRNSLNLVRKAVESTLSVTSYPNYEIIVVDNDSDDPETLAWLDSFSGGSNPRVRVLRYHKPFNYSAINNFAVKEAVGEVVGLLNSDIEAIAPDWLSEMVSHAVRPGIGAVGAMLYYPQNTVQHAGVVLGLGGVAGHPFKDFPRGDSGQKNRLRLVQNYSAVTAACLVIKKDRFLAVGGLNEKDLAIAFNDVDLCCKLVASGLRNVWTPFAEFYHHESATRGVEDTPSKKARFQSEVDYMMNTWGSFLMADPSYNPNLTLVGEDFSPAYLSRAQKTWLHHLP